MEYDPLIYGRNPMERIVCLEPTANTTEIFQELEDGSLKSTIVPNKYWILAYLPLDDHFKPLKGNLHYKYAKEYADHDEFLSDRRVWTNRKKDIFTIFSGKESFMLRYGYTYFKGMKLQDVSILSFDIETTGLKHDKDAKILLISNTFRKKGQIIRKLFCYNDYESPKEMLEAWVHWVRMDINPSIIVGHNIYSFDLPYISHVAQMCGAVLGLGRDGSEIEYGYKESKFRKDQSQFLHYHKVKIHGREVIDTMFLAIKHDIASKKYESYGLKPIIAQEGLEAQGRVFYDASKIRFKYQIPEEWEKIKAYAMFDADDSLALYDLMAPAPFYATQSIPKSYQTVVESASGSQINAIMVRSYIQYGHSIPKASDTAKFQGAISFGNAGIYSNVFKIDVASLYPSIILQDEVYDERKDPKGNFLKFIETFTKERLKNKKLAKQDKYYDDLQNAQKIFINSGYGFLGTTGLNFNSVKCAEFVTKRGREILQEAIEWAGRRDFRVVNADTDSIAFCRQDNSKFTEEEQVALLQEINELFPEKIRFEHDGIFERAIILKAKNYILWDGVKIKQKGSSLKSSSFEIALKEFNSKIIKAILDGRDNYVEIYNQYVNEIYNVKDIKRWCSKKTITEKTMNSERKNETKIKDAIAGNEEYVEGSKVYVYFKEDDSLGTIDNFDGNYNKAKLLEKLFKATSRFKTILNTKELFLNYKLKKNAIKLQEILLPIKEVISPTL